MINASQFCTHKPITIQTANVDRSGHSELTALNSESDQAIIEGLDSSHYNATYMAPGEARPEPHQVGGQEAYYLFDALTWDGVPKEDPNYLAYTKIARDLMMVSQNQP